MEKRGQVKAGETPSALSGKQSSKVVKGEALAEGERYPKKTIDKTAKILDN